MSATDAQATAEPLRQRLLSYVRERIGEVGQHAMISTKDIAAHFSVTPVTISKHLHALAEEGHLHTKAAGPKGTIITLEAGPKRGAAQPSVRARAAGAAGAPTLRRVGGAYYCPWCGSNVQKVWRYCNRCGKQLPH